MFGPLKTHLRGSAKLMWALPSKFFHVSRNASFFNQLVKQQNYYWKRVRDTIHIVWKNPVAIFYLSFSSNSIINVSNEELVAIYKTLTKHLIVIVFSVTFSRKWNFIETCLQIMCWYALCKDQILLLYVFLLYKLWNKQNNCFSGFCIC